MSKTSESQIITESWLWNIFTLLPLLRQRCVLPMMFMWILIFNGFEREREKKKQKMHNNQQWMMGKISELPSVFQKYYLLLLERGEHFYFIRQRAMAAILCSLAWIIETVQWKVFLLLSWTLLSFSLPHKYQKY